MGTPIGFDSTDHVLDVRIAADRSSNWTDEDEFVVVQSRGLISSLEATAIRAEGERVIAALEQGTWLFDAEWEQWQPDPARSAPAIPDGRDTAHGVLGRELP